MALNKKLIASIGGAFLAAGTLAAPALALEAKQCLPMAEMNAALKAEGQRTLILGDRLALQNPTGKVSDASVDKYANAVTSNADGSLGYQLEGNKPRVVASTSMCVAAKLTDIRLYDARKTDIPNAVMLGGRFNGVVQELAAKGSRAMVVANTLHANGDAIRRGLPLVVFGNVDHRTGSLSTMTAQGPQMLALMGDVDYTPEALRRLSGAVTQISMNMPN